MIYVETLIASDLETVWEYTQNPALHERWDLRFTSIEYLPREEGRPQRFRYATRLGFGLRIEGEGETVGERLAGDCRTSALKFWSDDPKSLILEGSGYWKYEPMPEGIRFFTGYDYKTRFGFAGRVVDGIAFRPLLSWATAWSFDALRLWLEKSIPPEVSARNALVHALVRSSLGLIWIYQGLVPKLMFPETGEWDIVRASGIADPKPVVFAVGIAECLLGVAILAAWRWRGLLLLQSILLSGVTVVSLLLTPDLYKMPFNPASLNLAMIALGLAGWMLAHELPSARRCKRKP